jgi:drug/metabolite transporter superfamily protein YnfA
MYSLLGLKGLGITFVILGIMHMTIMTSIVYYLYKIRFTNQFLQLAAIVLAFAICSSLIQSYLTGSLYYVISGVFFLVSLVFSLSVSKRRLGVDFISIIKTKIR